MCEILSLVFWRKKKTVLHILGKHMKLSPGAEEVATFFAKMLEHEYTTKDIFRKNFFKDWRKVQNHCHISKRVCSLLM